MIHSKSVMWIIILVIGVFFKSTPVSAQEDINVVLVVTSCASLQGMSEPTGYWGEELVIPFNVFQAAGFSVDIASPKGGRPPLDPRSKTQEIEKSLGQEPLRSKIENTIPLSSVNSDRYDAVFIVGGHGVLGDLVNSSSLSQIVNNLVRRKKVIAAVCHGPAALVDIKNPDTDKFVLAEHFVTGFSNKEEALIGLCDMVKSSPLNGLLEDRLNTSSGGYYSCGLPWQPYAKTCCNIVTGQNPGSSEVTAHAVTKLLDNNNDKSQTLSQFIEQIPLTLKTGMIPFAVISVDDVKDNFEKNKLYDALAKPINWSQGYATLYIGSRKKNFPRSGFIRRCFDHIKLAREKLTVGHIQGYIVFLTPDYYVSFANWESKEFQESGGTSENSKVVIADGGQFMNDVVWADARQIPEDYMQKLNAALSELRK